WSSDVCSSDLHGNLLHIISLNFSLLNAKFDQASTEISMIGAFRCRTGGYRRPICDQINFTPLNRILYAGRKATDHFPLPMLMHMRSEMLMPVRRRHIPIERCKQ